jgi:cytochrome bd-type quinol oxidase subunit 1
MKTFRRRLLVSMLLTAMVLALGGCLTTDEYGVGVQKKQPTRLANPYN